MTRGLFGGGVANLKKSTFIKSPLGSRRKFTHFVLKPRVRWLSGFTSTWIKPTLTLTSQHTILVLLGMPTFQFLKAVPNCLLPCLVSKASPSLCFLKLVAVKAKSRTTSPTSSVDSSRLGSLFLLHVALSPKSTHFRLHVNLPLWLPVCLAHPAVDRAPGKNSVLCLAKP